MVEKRNVLVTGATGQQGGAVARGLIERDHKVRAVTRDPGSQEARRLERLGCEVVKGDFNDQGSIAEAADGMEAAYVMSTPMEAGPDAETKQANNVIDALSDLDLSHVVYSSVADADQETGIPFFDSKYEVEQHLRDKGVPYTIVAPVWFRENLRDPNQNPGMEEGRIDLALPADRPLQNIEIHEIGRFVTHVLENQDRFQGKRINIASDELTPQEMAQALSAVTGQQIQHNEVPLAELRKENEMFAKMFEWFRDEGYSADIPTLRKEYPEIGWRDFRSWANDQQWRIQRAVSH